MAGACGEFAGSGSGIVRYIMTTKPEKLHLSKLVEKGCTLCRYLRLGETPSEVHHIRTGTGTGKKAPHSQTIALCPEHHRLGSQAIHVLGRKLWEKRFGISELELLEWQRTH
jgi:hypothetical protein